MHAQPLAGTGDPAKSCIRMHAQGGIMAGIMHAVARLPDLACACMRRAGILAGSVDGTLRRFDVRAGTCYVDNLGHAVASIAVSHDGNCALAACLDSCMRLLDVQAGELLAQYHGEMLGTHACIRARQVAGIACCLHMVLEDDWPPAEVCLSCDDALCFNVARVASQL